MALAPTASGVEWRQLQLPRSTKRHLGDAAHAEAAALRQAVIQHAD